MRARQVSIEYSYEDLGEHHSPTPWVVLEIEGRGSHLSSIPRIDHVENLEVEDRSQIGGSAFNTIRYDEATLRLEIITNADLDIVATVTRPDVSVSVTDEGTGTKKVTEYLGGLIQSG